MSFIRAATSLWLPIYMTTHTPRPSYQSESHSNAPDDGGEELSRVEVQDRVGAVAAEPSHYGKPEPEVGLNFGIYRGMVGQGM